MKKILSLAAAMLLVTIGASAQTWINAGAGYADKITTISSLDPSVNTMTAVYAGISHNFPIVKNFGVEAGVSYFDSFNTKDMESLQNSSVKNRYNGLVVPVELNYSIGLDNFVKVSVFAGPTLHYGLTSKVITTLLGKSITTDAFENENENHLMFAATAGAAVQVTSFRIKIGYQYGLNNIDLTETATVKKNMLTIGLGYQF